MSFVHTVAMEWVCAICILCSGRVKMLSKKVTSNMIQFNTIKNSIACPIASLTQSSSMWHMSGKMFLYHRMTSLSFVLSNNVKSVTITMLKTRADMKICPFLQSTITVQPDILISCNWKKRKKCFI